MNKLATVLFSAFLIIGCGGSNTPAPKPAANGGAGVAPRDASLDGSWTEVVPAAVVEPSATCPNGVPSVIHLSFNSDGTYSLARSLGDVAELEVGHFSVSGNTIYFAPGANTCDGPQPSYTAVFQLNRNGLSLVTDGGTAVSEGLFSTIDSDAFVAPATVGCFTNQGFVAHALNAM